MPNRVQLNGASAAGLFSWMDVVEETDQLGIGEYKSSDFVHRHYWVESAIMAEGVSGDKPIFTNVLVEAVVLIKQLDRAGGIGLFLLCIRTTSPSRS